MRLFAVLQRVDKMAENIFEFRPMQIRPRAYFARERRTRVLSTCWYRIESALLS